MRSIPAGMRFPAAALSLVGALLLAGCMGGDDEAMTTTVRETVTETGTTPDGITLKVYLLDGGKVAPVSRRVTSAPAVGRAALEALLLGPEDEELATAISSGTEFERLSVNGGIASVESTADLSRLGQAQVVYTLTQFPTVRRVAINGARPLGRGAFENQTPAILVESPLPGESVESGFEVTGTANTFEATFNYELRDESGKVLAKDFVTATSGSGTRGTFRFTVDYDVPSTQQGQLVVFEISAADGSRTHESSVPLTLR
jgi:germination protein M